MTNPIAHTPSDRAGLPHDLQEHLLTAIQLAGGFVPNWCREWAEAAARWHDLGKYNPRFQAYLHACMAAAAKGQVAGRQRIDHSTAGAAHAVKEWGSVAGVVLAYVIAGHHAGLPDYPVAGDGEAGAASLSYRLQHANEHLHAALQGSPPPEVLRTAPFVPPGRVPDIVLLIRMIFSALVDADRLDTEGYMDPAAARLRVATRSRAGSMTALAALAQSWLAARHPPDPQVQGVNRLRQQLLSQCRAAAPLSPGLFSLTAPTGLGKTLSGLVFCLEHAACHGKDRVIYVAPYISIIEQTAGVYREVLGDNNVLEHHSMFDPDTLAAGASEDGLDVAADADPAAAWRLSTENWDAPVIVTTAVQFFESLFSAKPGRCRKLHRIANSVVFLDEAQLIPADFLRPIMRTLTELMRGYGVTFVLSTATQPALDPRGQPSDEARKQFLGVSGPRKVLDRPGNDSRNNRTEIVDDVTALFAEPAMQRFKVSLPKSKERAADWPAVGRRLRQCPAVLTIVNTRASALELHACMPKGTLHLSASMCPAHRSEVIARIKAALVEYRADPRRRVRVVSTQLVEAGVDLDFPVVFRAVAGLDSLAQSAGRCNREGLLPRPGRFVVFEAPKERLPSSLRLPQSLTRGRLAGDPNALFRAESFRDYFRALYWIRGAELDKHEIERLLPVVGRKGEGLDALQFRYASSKFRLVEDHDADIIVPWGADGRRVVEAIRQGAGTASVEQWRKTLRAAGRYSVGVPMSVYNNIVAAGAVNEIGEISLLTDMSFYSIVSGLNA